ncbi:ATP-dependent helicase/nuclease subunit A [Nymphon striatum]|nr:ATP-dependent helicase/nuclease subunit A [Nymphon striatum]
MFWQQLPIDLEFIRAVRDEAGAMGKARAYEFAYGCVVAFENRDQKEGFQQLRKTLLKDSGEAYKPTYLFAKDLTKMFPALAERYEQAATLMVDTNRRGLLDFEDLIKRTESMLLKQDVAAWVRMKLDQGIDHILVDEAQDTSPAQWRVIRTLADEFFDGETAGSNKRTVFAVGDEKQSIYSFQGADPRGFDDERLHFKVKVKNAERAFEDIALDASFRSTEAILSSVDHVFAYADHKRGIANVDGTVPRHRSLRENGLGH